MSVSWWITPVRVHARSEIPMLLFSALKAGLKAPTQFRETLFKGLSLFKGLFKPECAKKEFFFQKTRQPSSGDGDGRVLCRRVRLS
jgi:hypothetical protein